METGKENGKANVIKYLNLMNLTEEIEAFFSNALRFT